MKITKKQLEALTHAAHGARTHEMAAMMSLSCSAVEQNLARARAALGATNTSHAVWLAMSAGLIAPKEVENADTATNG